MICRSGWERGWTVPTRLALLVSLVGLGLSGSLRAEEVPAPSRIVAVGLFKNGLAVVQRELTVTRPGAYRLDEVPEPVHGTYWVESGAPVETLVTTREVEGPARAAAAADLQQELAGRKVTVHFRGGHTTPVSGTVEPPDREDPAAEGPPVTAPRGYAVAAAGPPRLLVLRTAKGRAYLEPAEVAYVEAEDAREKVKRRKPVLI